MVFKKDIYEKLKSSFNLTENFKIDFGKWIKEALRKNNIKILKGSYKKSAKNPKNQEYLINF